MQNMLSLLRCCIDDYQMIKPGDQIVVGLSGGKDSLTLLTLLGELRRFYPNPFTLRAICLDLGFGADLSPLEAYCRRIDVPLHIERTDIKEVVFDIRKEPNPCSLCAKMRRGALNEAAIRLGCRKVALGHHFDDAAETFVLSLFFEGRIGCFSPETYLDRRDITQIRPMLYIEERDIRRFAARHELPVIFNPCPKDKHSKREEVKQLLQSLEATYPDLRARIVGAMQRYPLTGWGKREGEEPGSSPNH